MVAFSTKQPDLLVHRASLDIITEYYPQPHSFSLFGEQSYGFIQLQGVSPVGIMTFDPSVLQEASPWMNLGL